MSVSKSSQLSGTSHWRWLLLTTLGLMALFAAMQVTATPAVHLQGEPDKLDAACALLDDATTRTKMSGMFETRLLINCGRESELGGVTAPGQPPASPLLGADVQVNDSSGDSGSSTTQSETSIALNENTGTICSGYNDSYHGVVQGQGYTGFSRSIDGGLTFQDGGALSASSFGDPSIVWRRSDGNFYIAALHSSGLGIWRSTDDCATFQFVSLIHSGSGDDKELMAVDNNPANGTYGRLYVAFIDFNAGARIFNTYSDDASTWSSPIALSGAGVDVQGAWPAVAPNGDLYVGWIRWNPYFSGPIDVEIARSTDGGVSFGLVTNPMSGQINPRASGPTGSCGRPALNGNIRYLPSPQLTVSPNGDLHVVYVYDPDGLNTGDVIDVFYRRSTDNGATWGPEIQLNDDGTQLDQFFPTISAGPSGRIVSTWYDRRLDAGNLMFDYYMRVSEDGGLTWAPSKRVSDVSSPVYIDPNLAACYHGDYDQQTQDATAVYIQWSDDRLMYNGHPDPDIWFDIDQFQADFTLSVTPDNASICAPADAVYTVDVDSILGFSDPVTLSAAGNPAGTTTNFSVNPVNPPGSSALTIGSTGAAAAGSYSIDIVGMAPTSTHTTTVGLDLFDMAPGAPSLTSPPDGATGVSSTPMFVWTGAAQGDTYTIEIATDPAFSNIIDTATVADITYTPATALPAGTTLYWRVWAANPCGSGSFSQTFSFTTLTCAAPNLAIPDNNPAGVTDDLVLTDSGSISDLDISILVQHTWVGDVVFELEHVDTGTSVTFYDRPGVPASTFGCSGNDIDATLDDEAATPVENECGAGTPTINGSFIPNNPLSAFDGESIAGTWRITASDHAGGDTGALLEWCVQAVSAYSASLTPSASAISALPGSTVVHDFTLANTGQQDDVYDLTVGGASWPTTLLTGTPLNVTAGSTATVSVEVDVPAVLETVHGMDTFTLTVASQGDPGLMLTATGTTTSETTSGIDLSTPQPQTGLVGQVLTYTVAVTNTGNYTDTFAITVGPHGWTTTAPASVGPLGPGQSATVEVLVTVGAGTSDSAMVTFTSTLDPAVSASVTLDSSTYVLFMPAVFRP